MTSNFEKYKTVIDSLQKEGSKLLLDDLISKAKTSKEKGSPLIDELKFQKNYQKWYSESMQVIKQVLPDRFDEFRKLYETDEKRKNITASNFSIKDWLLGLRSPIRSPLDLIEPNKKIFDDFGIVFLRFKAQIDILASARARFDSALYEIKQIVQADIFDSEIEAARELLKKGFIRASGAIAGVILEKHLGQVCENHNIAIQKKNPHISDYNDTLKNENIIEVATWRFIQRLGDLRNLCDHNKDREPTREEVEELINGVDKIMKTLN